MHCKTYKTLHKHYNLPSLSLGNPQPSPNAPHPLSFRVFLISQLFQHDLIIQNIIIIHLHSLDNLNPLSHTLLP